MKNNHVRLAGLGLSLLLLLSGCVQTQNGVPTGEGWVYKFLVAPTSNVIRHFAIDQALGFGLAIIIVTILVRVFIIMPLGFYQSWQTTYQTEKRNYFSHILDPLNKRLREAETNDEKMAIQAEIMAANKHYGLSLFGGMGCLPIFVQLPFFQALFYAARYTEGLTGSSFLWFRLDKPDMILTAIIAALYLLQSYLSMQSVPDEQKQQMKSMMYSMPLFMAVMGLSYPSGVSLYFLVGGIFAIIQQLMTTYILKPKLKAKVAEEYRLNPPKPFRPQAATGQPKDVTSTDQTVVSKAIGEGNKKRNAGKQNR